jgi:hypothetical protein
MSVRPEVVYPVLLAIGVTACGAGLDGRHDTSDGQRVVPEATGRDDTGSSAAPTAGSLPSYPFRLVNPRPYVVIVLASAGAAEVVVDTVPAADSSRVDLLVETDLVRLRAVDLEGNELGSGYLSVRGASEGSEPADSIFPLRWELPPPP